MRAHGCVQLTFSGGIERRIRHLRPTFLSLSLLSLLFLPSFPDNPFPPPNLP